MVGGDEQRRKGLHQAPLRRDPFKAICVAI